MYLLAPKGHGVGRLSIPRHIQAANLYRRRTGGLAVATALATELERATLPQPLQEQTYPLSQNTGLPSARHPRSPSFTRRGPRTHDYRAALGCFPATFERRRPSHDKGRLRAKAVACPSRGQGVLGSTRVGVGPWSAC